MPSQIPIYLSGFSINLGESKKIENLLEGGVTAELIEKLRKEKNEFYTVCQEDPYQMAINSLQNTLSRISITPAEIDHVIFASDTGLSVNFSVGSVRQVRNAFIQSLAELGLCNAVFLNVSGNASNNLGAGLLLAKNLISNGDGKHILLVGADVIIHSMERVLLPVAGILSDGASSCLISSEKTAGVELLNFNIYSHLNLAKLKKENNSAYLLQLLKSIKHFSEVHYDHFAIDRKNIPLLFMNNYSFSTMQIYAYQLGFSMDKVWTAAQSRYGHLPHGDILLNINNYLCSSNLFSQALIFQSGLTSFSLGEANILP